MRRLSVALLVALLAGACRPPVRAVSEAGLREVVRAEVEGCRAFGLSVAVVRGEELVFAEAAGEADLLTGRPVTPDTVFMLFSISKLFTATAVMQLVDRGLVDLDRPVAEYLPGLAIRNPFDRPVTVRTLLEHSSGLPNPLPFAWARPASEPRPPLRDHAEAVLRDHGTLRTEPGTRHRYTNVGYLVLGLLVEQVSGQPFEAYVTERILEPLEMERTGFRYSEAMAADMASGSMVRGSLVHLLARANADRRLFGPPVGRHVTTRPFLIDGASYGGMVGTAPEVARFLSMHLAGGTWRGRRILSEASVAAMQVLGRTPSGEPLEYALGWHVEEQDGVRSLNHMGTGGGFRPEVRIYPDRGLGVVVLANRTEYDPRAVSHTLLEADPGGA